MCLKGTLACREGGIFLDIGNHGVPHDGIAAHGKGLDVGLSQPLVGTGEFLFQVIVLLCNTYI